MNASFIRFFTQGMFLVVLALFSTAAMAAPEGVLQGMKLDQNQQAFVSPGATVSIRAHARAANAYPMSAYKASFGPGAASYSARLAPGTYELGMQVPDGYSVSYSVCNNCREHPAQSFRAYGNYNSAPVLVKIAPNSIVDVAWKFVPTGRIEFPTAPDGQYQSLQPADSANEENGLSQRLTCNVPGVPNPTLPTDRQLFSGTSASVEVGLNRDLGAIGVWLKIINPRNPSAGLQVIDARSSGGAAWQSTLGLVAPPDAEGHAVHSIAHFNQAAGNSAELWGFGSPIAKGPEGLSQANWVPLFSNDVETAVGSGVSSLYSPCYHSGVRFGNGRISIQQAHRGVSQEDGSKDVLGLTSTYTFRALGAQSWGAGSADEQALYLLRHAARLADLRVYWLAADGKSLAGPVRPYESFAADPVAKAQAQVVNCPANPSAACFLKTQPTRGAILVWKVGGEDIAMAIHGTNQQAGVAPVDQFTGVINLRRVLMCKDTNDDNCGNVQWHTVFNLPATGSLQNGQDIVQTITYDFGTVPEIGNLMGVRLPSVQ